MSGESSTFVATCLEFLGIGAWQLELARKEALQMQDRRLLIEGKH